MAKSPGVNGNPRPTLRVNLHTGSWTDFSTGKRDYDLVSLAKYVTAAALRPTDLEAMFAPFQPRNWQLPLES